MIHFVAGVLILGSPNGVNIVVIIYHQQNCKNFVDGFFD